jgi:hypothetical protein
MKFAQLAGLISIFFCFPGLALAEPQLYETGPSEESSYVRFVNATENTIEIISSNGSAKVELNAKADGRASRFFTVKAGSKLTANIQGKGSKSSVEVTGKPWEYITIAILPVGASQFKSMLIRETPTDFNAMRASVALFNLDASCTATMQGGAQKSTILEGIKPFTVQRRLINPVNLSATVGCGGQNTKVDLGQLEAGGRYSVFLSPLKNVHQAWFVHDAN